MTFTPHWTQVKHVNPALCSHCKEFADETWSYFATSTLTTLELCQECVDKVVRGK